MITRKQYLMIFFLLGGVGFTALAITRLVQKEPAVVQTSRGAVTAPHGAEASEEETSVDADPWEELQQITDAYSHPSGISYKGQIKVIDASGDQEKVLEETPFEYTLHGDAYHYLLGDVEMVRKNNLGLLVNHSAKVIALTPKASSGAGPFDLNDFRKQLENAKATLKVSELNGDRVLTVDELADPTIQGYRVFYAPDSYRIRRVELGMQRLSPLEEGEADRLELPTDASSTEPTELRVYTYFVELNFSSVQPLNLKKGEFRPEVKFITYDQHTLKLTPAYSAYTLLNAEEH